MRKYNGIAVGILQAHVEGVDNGEFCRSVSIIIYAVGQKKLLVYKEDIIVEVRTGVLSVGLKHYRAHRICPASG
jgi:hypothetical protein